jgi:cellulose synthase/poly-beta-1,6-N-acetylglucosamine synthase-like glycosyltransferase
MVPGFVAMPATLLHGLLGLVPWRRRVVRSDEPITVVSPMFNEEAGAEAALRSLLGQESPLDAVVVSINGGTDRTPEVVAETLHRCGYERASPTGTHGSDVRVTRWRGPAAEPPVTVIEHPKPTSKADAVNFVVSAGYATTPRVLIVDGDTRFDRSFVDRLREGLYEIRFVRRPGGVRAVLENVEVQSGAVASLRPGPGRAMARFISWARSAEYALAALVRVGQTLRAGRRGVTGRSRLFTAVGCGFTVRRDAFPMPSSTITEDHDFTLAVQNRAPETRVVSPAELDARGVRIVESGRVRAASELFDMHDKIVERRAGTARFELASRMWTEDPPDVPAYLRQVERWHLGGMENAWKRVRDRSTWRDQRANVRFASLAAQLENVLGVLLLLSVPLAAGLHVAAPGVGGMGTRALLAWLAIDVVATSLFVFGGAARLERASGATWSLAGRAGLGTVARGVVPLLVLRLANLVALLTAARRAVGRILAEGRALRGGRRTWAGPSRTARGMGLRRFAFAALALVIVAAAGFEGVRRWAAYTWPDDRTVERLVRDEPRIDQEEHRDLPLPNDPGPGGPVGEPAGPGADLSPVRDRPTWIAAAAPFGVNGAPPAGMRPGPRAQAVPSTPEGGLSSYCPPAATAVEAPAARRLDEGATPTAAPLSRWGRLTLARLAPLLPYLEEAATAYDVPADLLLQVLLNESYLDPLAVGPTDDLGIAQMTSATLTLVSAISTDESSRFANPRLFDGDFSVFDPTFSLCAGAALLAWSRSEPGGEDPAIAYARYVNPRHGVVRGDVSPRHRSIVDDFQEVRPMVDALARRLAAARRSGTDLPGIERRLLGIAEDVRRSRIDLLAAYRRAAEVASSDAIDDAAFYEDVLTQLYPASGETEE